MTSVGTMQEKPLNEEDESVQTEESTEIVGVEERGDMSLDIQSVNVNYTINGGKIISIIIAGISKSPGIPNPSIQLIVPSILKILL